jgi:hypothetical protein
MSPVNELWKDQALLAINQAVVVSFRNAGFTAISHHTMLHEFMLWCTYSQLSLELYSFELRNRLIPQIKQKRSLLSISNRKLLKLIRDCVMVLEAKALFQDLLHTRVVPRHVQQQVQLEQQVLLALRVLQRAEQKAELLV